MMSSHGLPFSIESETPSSILGLTTSEPETPLQCLERLVHTTPPSEKWLKYFPDVVRDMSDMPWHHPIFIYKVCYPNRRTQFYSDVSGGYRYSKGSADSVPLLPWMHGLIREVNEEFGEEFDSILGNYYPPDGSIARHRDKDVHGANGVVALSYGAERALRMRDNAGRILRDVPMPHGSALHMRTQECQDKHTHEIPVSKKIKEPRWSLTLRKLV